MPHPAIIVAAIVIVGFSIFGLTVWMHVLDERRAARRSAQPYAPMAGGSLAAGWQPAVGQLETGADLAEVWQMRLQPGDIASHAL